MHIRMDTQDLRATHIRYLHIGRSRTPFLRHWFGTHRKWTDWLPTQIPAQVDTHSPPAQTTASFSISHRCNNLPLRILYLAWCLNISSSFLRPALEQRRLPARDCAILRSLQCSGDSKGMGERRANPTLRAPPRCRIPSANVLRPFTQLHIPPPFNRPSIPRVGF